MLRFDPDTGLYADPTDRLRAEVRADWQAAFARDGLPPLNVEPETPAGQLVDSETALVATKDSEVLFMAQQFNPKTAEGVWQDALGQIYFLTRKTAEPSLVYCRCSGLAGTVVRAGALVQGVDGARFRALAGGVIPAIGPLTLPFAALEPGPLSVPQGSVDTIITVTPGWDTVTNPTAGAPGRHTETRAEFERRRAASVAKNAHGTVSALYGALADLPGVLDVVVLENTGNDPIVRNGVAIPGHSVYISMAGGDDAAIAETIYSKKDAGCGTAGNTELTWTAQDMPGNPVYHYSIERPDPLPFAVQVNIRLTPTTPATIVQDVRTAIAADFGGGGSAGDTRVKIASTVYASRFYAPAIRAGVQDLVSVKIAAPEGGAWADEIIVRADQLPVLSAQDVTVNVIKTAERNA